MFESCPCGVGKTYLHCCAPLHLGQRTAQSPEELMRSRYSAFAKGDTAYLLRSWDPATRPHDLGSLDDRVWTGLKIISERETPAGEGYVHFIARYRSAGGDGTLEERSRFRRINGAWAYVDGAVM